MTVQRQASIEKPQPKKRSQPAIAGKPQPNKRSRVEERVVTPIPGRPKRIPAISRETSLKFLSYILLFYNLNYF